jgi:hypothetical protein
MARFTASTDPNTKITWGRTTGGKTARMGRRTAAHVDYTIWRLSIEHPGATLHIIQSAYNTGVAASAGTHDRDGCLDVYIEGLSWWDAQWFLRKHGWAAWYRFPPAFGHHLHIISLGCTGPLGIFVPGQINDYYRHALGLKGQHNSGADHSKFPPNIAATIFDYPAWLEQKEYIDMRPTERAIDQLTKTAIPALAAAVNELKKVPAKRVKVRAQIGALTTLIGGARAVTATLRKLG